MTGERDAPRYRAGGADPILQESAPFHGADSYGSTVTVTSTAPCRPPSWAIARSV